MTSPDVRTMKSGFPRQSRKTLLAKKLFRRLNVRQISHANKRGSKIQSQAKLLEFAVRIRSPFVTTLSFLLASIKIDLGRKYTVLCIDRAIFRDDIYAMAKYSGQLNYILLPKSALIHLFHCFCPEDEVFNHRGYYKDRQFEQEKDNYYLYLKTMLPWILKFWNLNGVMVSNYVAAWHQELAKLCLDSGIPFIVLQKESVTNMASFDDFVRRYTNYKFVGTKILTGNESIRDALLSNDIKGLHKENTIVVGTPRLDRYVKEQASTGKSVVFFSFYPEERFNYMPNAQGIYNQLLERSIEFHKEVIRYAFEHRDVKVIIKTKANLRYLEFVNDIVDSVLDVSIPNLETTNKGNVVDLIGSAKAVIGFNSTTMIEGLLANKIVISPWFGDLITEKSWYFFSGYDDLLNYMTTREDLENILEKNNGDLKIDIHRRDAFCKPFVFIPDGNASVRAENEIIDAIKDSKFA